MSHISRENRFFSLHFSNNGLRCNWPSSYRFRWDNAK